MKQDIAQALEGYAVRKVELEHFVDSASYQPVVDSLVELNSSSDYDFLKLPSESFISALSHKSQGLMLTSALISGNEAAYAPLYASIGPNVGDLYAQDLPSLLGGSHAPLAISEMTRRATKSINVLESIGSSILRITDAVRSGSPLYDVQASIASSAWVEAHPSESQGLMTLVRAAPARIDSGALRENALSRYLRAGLKLAGVASVLAGIGVAGLYSASFAHQSAELGIVDMGSRATIQSVDAEGKVEQRKIVAFGEIGSQPLAQFYFDKISGQSLNESITTFTDYSRQGVAMRVKDGAAPGVDACVVQAHQSAPVSKDGNFYLFTDNTQGISDKNLFDFFYESHETSHCFSFYDNASEGVQLNLYQQAYSVSLNEISSDLGATLDYMRVTGTMDLYRNHIRPFRISNVNDLTHKTAWALDIILKDVDAASIKGISRQDIPEITRVLMEKHFKAADGTFSPGRLGSSGTTTINTPAANALFNEIIASKNIHNGRYEDLVKVLKEDIRDTMSSQQAAYDGVAPREVLDASRAGYEALAMEFKLEPLKLVDAPAVEVAQHTETLLSAYR